MDEKLLRVIDLVSQLRDAVKDCKKIISCAVEDDWFKADKIACQDGLYSYIHLSESCEIEFSNKKHFKDELDEHYTLVNGIKVFCLKDKEES